VPEQADLGVVRGRWGPPYGREKRKKRKRVYVFYMVYEPQRRVS
jgi:hypothetical protein